LALPKIFINGGKRGFLVEIAPDVLQVLDPTAISAAI
jgi:prolyl-tRNA editing enzyme YbaK/EbsC (Cys-tRNA(Pro) deacylase)